MSVALALPAPLWAHGTVQPPKAKDGHGVLLQKISIPGGGEGYLVAAAVPAKDEPAAVRAIAQADSRGATEAMMLVKGDDDSALSVLRETGLLKFLTIANAYDIEKIPDLGGLASSAKKKISEKLNALTAYCLERKEALVFAFIASGALGGLTVYSSSSVGAGSAVMLANMLWMSFLLTSQTAWGKALNAGGNIARWLGEKALGFFGRKLSDHDKKIFELTGKFTASLIPNAIVAGVVLGATGQLFMDSIWHAVAHATLFGVLLNYNIWDAVVVPKVESGRLSERFGKNYFRLQILLGTLLEVGSYLGFGYSQGMLALATMAGVSYLAQQEKIEETLIPRARTLGGAFRSKKSVCANALQSVKTAFARSPAQHEPKPLMPFPIWGDVQ